MTLSKRQNELLCSIIQEHIKTAEPVGSNLLVNQYLKNLSSATVRNEMLELDRLGFLIQPHTSAGRVPSEQAYKYYIENFLKEKPIKQRVKNNLKNLKKIKHSRERNKKIAKFLAQEINQAVIMAFSADDIYFTGLSYLFNQPEFQNSVYITNLSQVVDHLEEVLPQVIARAQKEVTIAIGEDNLFSDECSAIFIKYQSQGLLALIGPMRMDYAVNAGLVKYIATLLHC